MESWRLVPRAVCARCHPALCRRSGGAAATATATATRCHPHTAQRRAAPRSPAELPQEQLLEEGRSGTRRTAPLVCSGVMRDAPVLSERTDVTTCDAISVLNFVEVPPQTPRNNMGRFQWSRPEFLAVEKKRKQPCRKMETRACRTSFYKILHIPQQLQGK